MVDAISLKSSLGEIEKDGASAAWILQNFYQPYLEARLYGENSMFVNLVTAPDSGRVQKILEKLGFTVTWPQVFNNFSTKFTVSWSPVSTTK